MNLFARFFAPILCFIFLINGLKAQDIKISENISLAQNEDYLLVGQVADSIVALTFQSNEIELYVLERTSLKLAYRRRISIERRNINIIHAIPNKNDFTILYKSADSENSFTKIMRMDINGNIIDSTIVQRFNRWGVPYDPKAVFSEDKKTVLIYDAFSPNSIEVAAVNLTTQKLVWSHTFAPTDFDYNEDFVQLLADNNAGATLITARDNRKSKLENNRFEIYRYTPETGVWQSKISLSGKIWQEVEFAVDNKNSNIVAAGFYSLRNLNYSEGVFYGAIKINEKDSPANIKYTPFDTDFMQQLIGKELKRQTGFRDIPTRKLVLRNDGGGLLIAEYKKTYTRNSFNTFNQGVWGMPNTMPMQTDYEYGQIVLLSLHPNGDLHWKQTLQKRQYSEDDEGYFSSFFMLKTKNSLRFLYNDEIKAGANFNQYTVLGDGTAQRGSLPNKEADKLRIVFKSALQISATEVIVPSERSNAFQIVKIAL